MTRRFSSIVKFVAVQALLLLLIVEVALRVLEQTAPNLRVLLYLPSVGSEFDRVETLPELLNTTILGYKPYEQVAGFIRNSRGFRTHEYRAQREEGVARVLVIGDSFAFSSGGIPFESHWPRVLERNLQSARRLELLCLGVPGVGPLFELRMWQIEGTRLNPDILLLQLFIGNDFTDHYATEVEEAPLAVVARWSYTIRLLRNGARVLKTREAVQGLELADDEQTTARRGGFELPGYPEHYKTIKPIFTRERLMRVESQRARLCEESQREAYKELLQRMTSVLRDFRSEVEAAGVQFRVVIIPDRFQVNVDEKNEILELLGMPEELFDWDKPQRDLRAFFEQEGISYLDLLPAFREASRSEQMYDPGNTHWNVRGNEFAARQIATWLVPSLPESP